MTPEQERWLAQCRVIIETNDAIITDLKSTRSELALAIDRQDKWRAELAVASIKIFKMKTALEKIAKDLNLTSAGRMYIADQALKDIQ